MVSRLVLGCGTVGQTLVEAIADGQGSLLVIDDAESRINALREEGVSATIGDPTDPEIVNASVKQAEMVVVADSDPETNRRATELAVELFPEAYVVAYLGDDCNDRQRERITQLADHSIDPTAAVVEQVLAVALGNNAVRTANLRRTIRRVDGTLGVFMHDNPDPDAIASAVALCRIAEEVGIEATPCYFGEISHQENRAFVNLLDLDLRNFESHSEFDSSEFAGIALVDHSRPGINDQLPKDTEIDIVVDHHPPNQPVKAKFVDLRSDVGATSTLLAGHIQRLGFDLSEAVATGLMYGIRVDTKDFAREVSTADFEAASYLLPYVNTKTLDRVESPSVSPGTFEVLARAIRNWRIEDSVLATCVGSLSNRDALSQAADQLLNMEGVTTTLVYGFMNGTVYISARARGTDINLGETMRAAFDQIGSAGGHAEMAGAQIPLGLLGGVEDEEEESLASVLNDVITDRFLETIQSGPRRDSEYAHGGDESFDATVLEGED